ELNVNDANIDRNSNDVSSNNQYQWFKDDVEIPGADASIYTIVNAQISDSGVYYCEITNPLLPDLTIIRANITVTVDENLGVDDFDYNDFKMYPNPAKDWITIKTKPLNNGKMQIFNMTGQLILEKPLTTEITSLTVDQLTSGVYLISITSDIVNTTKRFIKE
ncbi:MAG: T9SS type A sorting domain-containing protein, partial [Psychroserpens sp.]|nr:T9SS type A sorting domain-containing protein [Psychroserpens sp.]